jgi:aminoglycoside phosphotransferase (APT) family kinase protein
MTDFLAALPAEVQSRVAQVLAAAFPGAQPDALEALHGGLSGSPMYKLVVGGRPYVLRVMLERSLLDDPVRQLACMQIASERVIAPHVAFASTELAASISDYVAHQPGQFNLRQNPDQIAEFGDLLRHLHTGPAFPPFLSPFDMIRGGLDHLAQHGVRLPRMTQTVLAQLDAVQHALGPHLVAAPCHNDLNPGNVLYDGTRPWLVDWEAAGMGEPMFDLAGAIHWFMLGAEHEAAFLQAYFQRAPTAHEQAKLTLAKHVSWWMYAITFLLVCLQSAGPGSIAPGEPEEAPSFAATMAAVGRGELRMGDPATQQRMSLAIARQSFEAMQGPAFGAALAQLRGA